MKNIILLSLLVLIFNSISYSQDDCWIQTDSPGDEAVWDMAFDGENIYLASFGYYLFHSGTDFEWEQDTIPMEGSPFRVEVHDGNIFISDYRDELTRSSDKGKSWSTLQLPDSMRIMDIHSVNSSKLFLGTDKGIFETNDNGESWFQIPFLKDSSIFSIVNYNNTIYAGSIYNNIFKSTNNGISWEKLNTGLPDTLHSNGYPPSIMSITSDNNGDILAVSNYNGIIKSDNDGESWSKLPLNLTDEWLSDIKITNDGIIYISSSPSDWQRPVSGLRNRRQFIRANKSSASFWHSPEKYCPAVITPAISKAVSMVEAACS